VSDRVGFGSPATALGSRREDEASCPRPPCSSTSLDRPNRASRLRLKLKDMSEIRSLRNRRRNVGTRVRDLVCARGNLCRPVTYNSLVLSVDVLGWNTDLRPQKVCKLHNDVALDGELFTVLLLSG